jgi:hypothetical protein
MPMINQKNKMPTKEEKERRKGITAELAKKENEEFLASLPVPEQVMHELFDYLDEKLMPEKCNHDYPLTIAYLESKGLEKDEFIIWARENGGYCDCEILWNIPDRLE